MAQAAKDEETTNEIDMERVVSDSDYRRRVITRLRRVRELTRSPRSGDEGSELASGDDD
jgi:hypothetical protein